MANKKKAGTKPAKVIEKAAEIFEAEAASAAGEEDNTAKTEVQAEEIKDESVSVETKETAPEKEKSAESEEMALLREQNRLLMEQLQNMQKSLENAQRPQVVQIAADVEKVVLRFQAEVADDNVAVFGANGMYGQVTGKTGTVIVPKSEWSRFYNEAVRRMMDKRWLIVLSGMDEDERELYNVNYREGELLDQKAFTKMLDMTGELPEIFALLCPAHQEMVGRRFIEAFNRGDYRVKKRELIVKLNELSKKSYVGLPDGDVRRKGIFMPLIEAMNAEETKN